ncbi:MAG: hypothetical protein LBV45_09340 [Xanthomonadaceae bacterium]|nr:hypothetical protein [Xanthomonadaceae bacterium]
MNNLFRSAFLASVVACIAACSSEPPPEPPSPPPAQPRGALTEAVRQPMERTENAFHQASEQERATIDAMEKSDTEQ